MSEDPRKVTMLDSAPSEVAEDQQQTLFDSDVAAPAAPEVSGPLEDDIPTFEAPIDVEETEDVPETEDSARDLLDEIPEAIFLEDLDDEDEIWEGGPKAAEAKKWKEQFGTIYSTSISLDTHFLWRTLRRSEYKAHVKQMEQLTQSGQMSSAEASMFNEEQITEMCLLYPRLSIQDMNGDMAGIPALICQEIMEASGFTALEVRQL